jgi:hypothetical protein
MTAFIEGGPRLGKWAAPIVSSVLFACAAESQPAPVTGERSDSSLRAAPQASAALTGVDQLLPQGLTCGLSYTDSTGIQAKNTCMGVPTMQIVPDTGTGTCYSGWPDCRGCDCIGSPAIVCGGVPIPYNQYPVYQCTAHLGPGMFIQNAPGFTPIWDNDTGVGFSWDNYTTYSGPWGFWHQELLDGTTDIDKSDSFVLPKGTACGLHNPYVPWPDHRNRTCMGYNPAKWFGWETDDTTHPAGCPPGWSPKQALDMGSSWGHWIWCEYQDPRNLSPGALRTPDGVACGMGLNEDPGRAVGQCMGLNTDNGQDLTACPANTNMKSSHWYDDGRSAGRGLGWCTTRDFVLPPRAVLDTPTSDHTGNLNGWAYDPATPSASIAVDFYVDGPAGLGTGIARVTADGSRPDVNAVYVITGNHGFSFSLPAQYRDGKVHSVYAYAIGNGANSGNNPAISNTPAGFRICGAGTTYCSYTNSCIASGASCAACVPRSCEGGCGTVSNGCGGTMYCGACPPTCKNCYVP